MTRVFHTLAEVPAEFGPCVAAIGNFDGVHLGHKRILANVIEDARRMQCRSLAITFEPHPEAYLRPGNAPKLLAPPEEKLRLLAETGVDAMLVLRFDAELAAMPARDFAAEILAARLRVKALHEGPNFRFGRGAEAGVAELAELGRELSFAVRVEQPVLAHGIAVSSSAIRKLVTAGDVRRARWLLGRPYTVVSHPVRDRGIGAKLLVPTINFAPLSELLPAPGVYVTCLSAGSRQFQAVTNVGNRPTFPGAGFAVESHVLNFEPMELAPETRLELGFLHRLREERTFENPDALKAQILRDVARARRLFRGLQAGVA